ncbi:MAG: hypothetical protein ACLTNQ_11800, partial [Phocaeicola coprophilus]
MSLVYCWKFVDMVFTVLRATYFKRTKRLFENSDYESFGIINEKCELINTGALLADYPPVRHLHIPEHTRSLSGSLLGYKT